MNKLAHLIEQNRSQNMRDKQSHLNDLIKQAKSIKKVISKTEKERSSKDRDIKNILKLEIAFYDCQ